MLFIEIFDFKIIARNHLWYLCLDFSFNRKRDKRKIAKRTFQKMVKSEKNTFRNFLHPFGLLLNQPFVYSFVVKKFTHGDYRNFRF